jgi:DNA-binding transcriptional LysR family regulator
MAIRDLDTALLRTFLTLADTLSFSRTAERVGRSQPAVSGQIRKLEELLGAPLFLRDTRTVRLTPEGERLRGEARALVDAAQALIARFQAPEVEGEVRFGSPEDFATAHLPDVLAAFGEAFPRVRLTVTCELTAPLIAGFDADAYDLIVIKQDPRDLHPGARPLWRERLVWAAGPRLDRSMRFADHVAAWRARDGAAPLVLSPDPCVYRRRAVAAMEAAGVPWRIGYTSPSLAGAAAAVKAGLGVTALPRDLARDGLHALDPALGWPVIADAEICLLARSDASAATRALAGFIEDSLGRS